MNERLEYGASERTGEDADVRIVGHRAPPPRDPGELTERVFVVAAVGRGPVRFGERTGDCLDSRIVSTLISVVEHSIDVEADSCRVRRPLEADDRDRLRARIGQ